MSSKVLFESDKGIDLLTKESVIRMHKKWNILWLKVGVFEPKSKKHKQAKV